MGGPLNMAVGGILLESCRCIPTLGCLILGAGPRVCWSWEKVREILMFVEKPGKLRGNEKSVEFSSLKLLRESFEIPWKSQEKLMEFSFPKKCGHPATAAIRSIGHFEHLELPLSFQVILGNLQKYVSTNLRLLQCKTLPAHFSNIMTV